jgi:hypothetical protein
MEISMTLHSLDHVRTGKAGHHIVLKNRDVEKLSLASFARLRTVYRDTIIKTGISSRLACFAVALIINGLIFAGVNHLFHGKVRLDTAWISLAYANSSRLPRKMSAQT